SRVGIFATLSLAVLGGVYFGTDFKFTSLTIFAGTIAVFSVREIKRRAPFVTTAGLVFLAYATMLGGFWLFDVVPLGKGIVSELVLIGSNSVLVLLAQPLVLIFERLFRMTTDVTLLELSDTNRNVLRELSIKAPGSFNHSLQVANLAEAAADAIGANALLARVGALYHDIGKMQKPEYFVENQRSGYNPHDRLKPRMSALIIGSHVRDGIDLGRQERIPDVVLDFITMHHGTARMEYFYNKALQTTEEGEQPPAEGEFRYPGPRPNSRETGIVMLADSVEAASRSIEHPTQRKLESMVNSIFESRIADGQLDHCPLTFADINTIRATLLSMLSGIHHFRVKYPGQDQITAATETPVSEAASSEAPDVQTTEESELEASPGGKSAPEHVE
ncbi:MAG TPA: HDIG domain-containing metalloprotein, partial [Rhodothermia bacterium]